MSTDDKSETENTLSIKLLQIKNEYETPNNSNFYQKNENFDNLETSGKKQITTDLTKQEIEENSNMRNNYQNTTNKIHPPQEKKLDNSPFCEKVQKVKIINHQTLKLIF